MNIKSILNVFLAVGPSVKSWIFSDGKFVPKRAIILIVTLVLLTLGTHFFGEETVNSAVDALDEISDVIGYGD